MTPSNTYRLGKRSW